MSYITHNGAYTSNKSHPSFTPGSFNQQPPMTAMLMSSDLNRDTNWYPDSGATNHITHDMNNLDISHEAPNGQQIQAANGSGMSITHTGSSSFISPTNHIFHLKNLLHVPTVTKISLV